MIQIKFYVAPKGKQGKSLVTGNKLHSSIHLYIYIKGIVNNNFPLVSYFLNYFTLLFILFSLIIPLGYF